MNKTTPMTVYVTPDHDTSLVFSDFTTYDHLSIADACLQSERDERNADRAARAAGAKYETIDLNSDLYGDEYADHILSLL